LASRWRRFFAICIDWLIYIVPSAIVGVLIALVAISDEMTAQEEEDAIFAVFMLVFVVATALYLFVYLPLTMSRHGARNGQTLGKQALGVRVVTAEGVPVTYGRVMRRELLGTWLINWVTGLYFFVDYGFGLFDGRRQCLHDKIASTYVLQEQIPFGDGRPPLPLKQPAVYPPAGPYGAPPPAEQQPTYPAPQTPSHTPPAQPFGSYPSTLYDREPELPQREAAPEERPRHRWSPPRQGDGNDEARRAFGDDR